MRQPFFRRVLAIAATAIACSTALAQTYPAKPIKFLVPFPAGSATDVVGRQLADAMGKELGQSIIVDNKAGAQGTIGAAEVKNAAADGTLRPGFVVDDDRLAQFFAHCVRELTTDDVSGATGWEGHQKFDGFGRI